MTAAVQQQREARILWNDGRLADAAAAYDHAAELTTGFAKAVNLKCATECREGKPFAGQIKGVHYQ